VWGSRGPPGQRVGTISRMGMPCRRGRDTNPSPWSFWTSPNCPPRTVGAWKRPARLWCEHLPAVEVFTQTGLRQSRQAVARRFGVTPDRVRLIEVEGLKNEWPLPPPAGMPRRNGTGGRGPAGDNIEEMRNE